MTTTTPSPVARNLGRLRRFWAELDDAHRRRTAIRSPRVPVERQRHSDSAIQGTEVHLHTH
jgi:hypothetical protein